MQRTGPLVIAFSVLLSLIAMGTEQAGATGHAGARILRVAYGDDVASFDPDDEIIMFGLDAARVLYEGLVQYRPGTTELEGWLAKSWTISPDGRTYTFTLRDGATFQDQRKMTSADVLASFTRRKSPNMALSYFLDGVQEMWAPDPRTFVIQLKDPQPAFIDRLASPWGPKVVGPAALVDHAGHDQGIAWLNEHADGTGPYRLAEFTRGQRYVLTRNPSYWGAQPYFDRIELIIVPNVGQQILMLQRGELDILEHGYPFDQLDKLPPGLKLDAHDALSLEMACFNRAGALSDPAVREAVLTAINPSRWLPDAFGPFASPARSLYPKAMIGAPEPLRFPDDLSAAKRTIARAGPISIEIGFTDEEASVQQRVAEFMVSLLKQIGVVATLRVIPLDQESSMINDLRHAPDIWLSQGYPDAAHPGTQVGVFFQTGAALNLFGYSNPGVDLLATQAAGLTDVAQRDRTYLAISNLLFADRAFIPLADIKDVIVYRDDLTGLNTRPALPWSVDYETIRRQ